MSIWNWVIVGWAIFCTPLALQALLPAILRAINDLLAVLVRRQVYLREPRPRLFGDTAGEVAELVREVARSQEKLRVEFDRMKEFVTQAALEESPPSRSIGSPEGTLSNAPATRDTSEFRVVRELAHSLKTPLAGTESILLRLRPNGPTEIRQADWQALIASLDLCKAVIAAFREMTRVSRQADAWAPHSIAAMLASAHEVYGATLERRTTLELLSVPDFIPGYSSNLIVAAVLPLLENAVEATPEGARIVISCVNDEDVVRLRMDNPTSSAGSPAHGEHPLPHDGLGLATVERLIADGADGAFTHSANAAGIYSAEISLPWRSDSQ